MICCPCINKDNWKNKTEAGPERKARHTKIEKGGQALIEHQDGVHEWQEQNLNSGGKRADAKGKHQKEPAK